MKLEITKPSHLLTLLISCFFLASALVIRWLSGAKKNRIIFYGHKLNGNLKAVYDYLVANSDLRPYYASLDSKYCDELEKESVNVLKLKNFFDTIKVVRSQAIINDHGSQMLRPYLSLTSIKFIDVWHGIPYKGWNKNSFGEQKKYDQIWVSSPTMRQKYIKQYGFPAEPLKVTGYARTDILVNDGIDKQAVIKKYKIPKFSKYILLAPTWQQDVAGRSIIPFEAGESFFAELNKTAKKLEALIIFRAHLNVGGGIKLNKYSNIIQMSHKDYPVAEDFLALADILITDWSSIAFDFLALKRPCIFLDVPAPFAEGFTFGPEYRFGPVVKNLSELSEAIKTYTGDTKAYRRQYKKVISDTIEVAYGNHLDGNSTKNCYRQLKNLLE